MNTQKIIDVLLIKLDNRGLRFIWEILRNKNHSSVLKRVYLPFSKSRIVVDNGYILYCSCYTDIKGLFRKGNNYKETTLFGRIVCDEVKATCENNGFFTTDELPAYGISEKETITILESNNAFENDLVVCFAYNEAEATKTKETLDYVLDGISIQFYRILE